MNISLTKFIALTTIAASPFLGFSAAADEHETAMDDLKSYSCKDLMRMSGESRIVAYAILHGYGLGKKDTTAFNPEAMSSVSDQFTEACLDNPKSNALETFLKLNERL